MGSDLVVVAAEGVELRLQLAGGGRWWLLLQPFLEGLVESFDLAAGLRVVGPGVVEADAARVQGDLEGDAPVAAGSAGEHGAVVGEQAGRIPEGLCGAPEAAVDVGAVEHPPGVAVRQSGSGRRGG